jgi:hypothetical protein
MLQLGSAFGTVYSGIDATGGFAGTSTNSPYRFLVNGIEQLRITAAGHVLPFFSSTQDLGDATNRYRNVYAGTYYVAPSILKTFITSPLNATYSGAVVITAESSLQITNGQATIPLNLPTSGTIIGYRYRTANGFDDLSDDAYVALFRRDVSESPLVQMTTVTNGDTTFLTSFPYSVRTESKTGINHTILPNSYYVLYFNINSISTPWTIGTIEVDVQMNNVPLSASG